MLNDTMVPGSGPDLSDYPYILPGTNSTPGNDTTSPVIIVRAEELLIVLLVLLLWVGAIALFFNRWGKIRMLEPYQPKFQQQHRQSCPLVELDGPIGMQHRTFSKFNINCIGDPLYTPLPSQSLLRPRQNSVFVGSSATMLTLPLHPPRSKSAMDIQTLVNAEAAASPGFSGSLTPSPMTSRDMRRPSCSKPDVRRPSCSTSKFDVQRSLGIYHNFDKFDVRRPSCSKLLDKSLQYVTHV